MTFPWARALRAAILGAAGSGIVLAGSMATGRLDLGAPVVAAVTSAPVGVPVRASTLVCPGPETEGLAGVSAVPGGTTTVTAVSAPTAVLRDLVNSAGGELLARTLPEGPVLGTVSERGRSITGSLTGNVSAEVSGSEGLAPGLAAVQTWLRADSDDRALIATACQVPRDSHWLLAGAGDTTRRERLVVANPGGNTLTVDVTVFGAQGPVATTSNSRLAVPPRGRTVVLLDAIAPGEQSPAIHVVSTGGGGRGRAARLVDRWSGRPRQRRRRVDSASCDRTGHRRGPRIRARHGAGARARQRRGGGADSSAHRGRAGPLAAGQRRAGSGRCGP